MYRSVLKVSGLFFLAMVMFSICPSALPAMTDGDSLTVAAIQFEILPEMLLSPEEFRNGVEKAAALAMAEGEADLLVFPEYLGVFPALIPWGEYLNSKLTLPQVWEAVCADFPSGSAPASIKELFLGCAEQNDAFLDELWGKLARKYNIYILGGSRFTSFTGEGEKGLYKHLYNQGVVYNPEGRVCYRQNKVFLTEFEEEIPELSAGKMDACEGFWIKNKLVRLTICRDTFLKEWENLYREGFLWIDIKANGTAYTDEQKALFKRALPARLPESGIPWGMTLCLTGHVMDLFWEGESGIIASQKGKAVPLLTSARFDGFEVLRWTFPF